MFSATALGALTTPTPTDSMFTLVWIVKNMREMGCKPYLGGQNAKTAGIQIQEVKKTLNHIRMPKGLQVGCATQLFLDRVQS